MKNVTIIAIFFEENMVELSFVLINVKSDSGFIVLTSSDF